MRPEVHYARLGDAHIAYQVFGAGDLDLVYIGEFWHSIEAQWDEPRFAAFLRRLGSFARVICLDQRGSGMSDPLPLGEEPGLDLFTDDVRAVMDAVGIPHAAMLGVAGGSVIASLLAATVPERVQALVLLNGLARLTAAPDYPWGTTTAFETRVVADLSNGWGRGALADVLAPSEADDPAFRSWLARYQRLGASPGEVLAQRRMMQSVDIRQILPSIRTPTLVVHRRDNRLINVGHGRYLAEHIDGAEFVEVAGGDYLPFLGDAEAILAPIERFLTGTISPAAPRRVLATVLFTDIVGSTELAARLGDRRWRTRLEEHNAIVREELERHRGRELDRAGDGFVALFDGPARAVRCALVIEDRMQRLGLSLRAGVHTGEVELLGTEVEGLAVHICARVAASAAPGEVLVSSTVRDLVAGSGIAFTDRGSQTLRGVPGRWKLFVASSRSSDERD
jgi:class 3 adenylate cyclase/alpha-beta hydrolase superfamily lysophospholipase